VHAYSTDIKTTKGHEIKKIIARKGDKHWWGGGGGYKDVPRKLII
jgi:hypothetical protein